MHVLEQVQSLNKSGHIRVFLWFGNRERGWGRSRELNGPETGRKHEVPWIKSSVKNSRLEVMEKACVLRVGYWDKPLWAISVFLFFLQFPHIQYMNQITWRRRKKEM